MFGSCLLAAVAVLPAAAPASAPANEGTAKAQATEPLNIGFVLYTKSRTPGTLLARWTYANAFSGPGTATGGPKSGGFAGHYHVRYFLENGTFSDEYDLQIERHRLGQFYDVTWISNGIIGARGVGMEVAGGKSLAVGWRRVHD